MRQASNTNPSVDPLLVRSALRAQVRFQGKTTLAHQTVKEMLPEDSFFTRWLEAWPTAEPPLSYILFSAMSMLGAALGRRVYFDQDVHRLYPMLNLLLIGPSGIGKSTSIGMGFELIKSLPATEQPQIIKGKATPEKLHEDLVVQPHAIIFASELANFFSKSKYMEDMIPYVTQLLDYEDEAQRRTKGGSLQVVHQPSVTIVGGSTVEWLQGQLPDSAASGGFLARFLIVKEDHKGQRVPNPRAMLSTKQWLDMEHFRARVYAEFNKIVGAYEGRINYENYSAMDAYDGWYLTQTPKTGALSPFSARAGEFVMRISVLLALSCHRTSISANDIRSAIALYDYATAKLQEVVVPFTPEGKLIAQVLSMIGPHPVSDIDIKRAMRNSATSPRVGVIIQSLLESQDIVRLGDGKYRRASTR